MREFGKVRGSWPSAPALDSVSMGDLGQVLGMLEQQFSYL